MDFLEADKLVDISLKSKWEDTERRDYRILELKDPMTYARLGGLGTRGLMFLTVVSYDLYIDITLDPIKDRLTMVFRKDDSVLMKREYSNFELIETNLDAFITLVDEYVETTNRLKSFSRGKIPEDIIRNRKINKILT
jgi:hypothetical protein